MNDHERTELRNAIRAMWEQGLDTMDMAKALQIPQDDVERHLHAALDRRRSIIANLGKVLA